MKSSYHYYLYYVIFSLNLIVWSKFRAEGSLCVPRKGKQCEAHPICCICTSPQPGPTMIRQTIDQWRETICIFRLIYHYPVNGGNWCQLALLLPCCINRSRVELRCVERTSLAPLQQLAMIPWNAECLYFMEIKKSERQWWMHGARLRCRQQRMVRCKYDIITALWMWMARTASAISSVLSVRMWGESLRRVHTRLGLFLFTLRW